MKTKDEVKKSRCRGVEKSSRGNQYQITGGHSRAVQGWQLLDSFECRNVFVG